MLWLWFLILGILTGGLYNLFFKIVGKEINFALSLLIISAMGCAIALPLVLYYYFTNALVFSTKGCAVSAIMGASLALGILFFVLSFKFNAPLSIAIPVYSISILLMSAGVGVLAYSEPVNLRYLIAVVLGISSIVLLTAK